METHLAAKKSEGLSAATLRKLKYQLGTFEQFLSARSKFFPSEITSTDASPEYRSHFMQEQSRTKERFLRREYLQSLWWART